jgi:hypothetical protein
MHILQNIGPDLGQTYAHHAETCPKFQADLCTPCRNVPQISGRFLHTKSDIFEISGRLLHFWNMMLQNPLIRLKNKNESSSKPDK